MDFKLSKGSNLIIKVIVINVQRFGNCAKSIPTQIEAVAFKNYKNISYPN